MKDASNSIKKKKRIGMYVVLLFDFNEKVFLKKFFFFCGQAHLATHPTKYVYAKHLISSQLLPI